MPVVIYCAIYFVPHLTTRSVGNAEPLTPDPRLCLLTVVAYGFPQTEGRQDLTEECNLDEIGNVESGFQT